MVRASIYVVGQLYHHTILRVKNFLILRAKSARQTDVIWDKDLTDIASSVVWLSDQIPGRITSLFKAGWLSRQQKWQLPLSTRRQDNFSRHLSPFRTFKFRGSCNARAPRFQNIASCLLRNAHG